MLAVTPLRWVDGDPAGAEALAVRAAEAGYTSALLTVAWLHDQAGDSARAETLARKAVDCGNAGALQTLAEWRAAPYGLLDEHGNISVLPDQSANRIPKSG